MRNKIKQALTGVVFALLSSVSVPSYGIMANPKAVMVKQPDGSCLMVRIHGDESHHFVTTLDGYRVARDSKGFYKYVTFDKVSNKLTLLDLTAHNLDQRSSVENSRLLSIQKASALDAEWRLQNKVEQKRVGKTLDASVLNPSGKGSWSGKRFVKALAGEPNESQYLCILVNFADCRMKFKNENFDNFLNQRNYDGTGSVKDYFRDNSNGKFVPNFVTVGPYTLSKAQSAYANNDYETGSDIDPRSMVIEAVNLAKEKNPALDFRLFDNDGDGFMDNVYVIYAGYSEASTGEAGDMWPHSWTLGDQDVVIDGITIHNYSCSQELVGSPATYPTPAMDGIGTFTHEFGHILGLKDMYDTDDYYNGYGVDPGDYSLYASGSYNNDSRTPAALWAFERLQMGWMEIGKDIKELKAGEDVTQANSGTGFTARYINCQPGRSEGSGYEWFILENRQYTGWDAYIPGHGLLIYHYDYTKDSQDQWWSVNGPNNNARHRCLYIKAADGIDDANSRSGDTYPGTSANTSFTDFSTPNALNWSGNPTNVPITNILERDGVVYYQAAGGSSTWNVINTGTPTGIRNDQAHFSASVVQKVGTVSEIGFCWEEGMKEPTVASSHKSVAVSDTPEAVVSGLKAGTQYTVKAYMKMNSGTVVYGSPINFKTEYPTAYAPFKTNFTSWTNGKIDGWEIIDRNGDGTTWLYDKLSKSICYQFDYWNNADDWLIGKRRYHVPENGVLYIQRGVNEEQYIEGLEVYVSTKSSNIEDFYLHKPFTIADNFGQWVYEEVDLSMYAGQDIYIALRCNSERMQGLLRLLEVRLEQKLDTPAISYFGVGESKDQLRIEWNAVQGASQYYLYLGRVTENPYNVVTFTPISFYEDFSQNVDLGTGHIFFKGNGYVELKAVEEAYTDLKFMLYPTGPVGVSYLEIEGSVDGNTWMPICPRVAVSAYDSEGIECNYVDYVKGRGFRKLRFRFTDNGRLAHIRYLTVGYLDGFYWDQLAAGSVKDTKMVVNAKTTGEFTKGKYVAWVASGTSDGLFFDESESRYYEPKTMANDATAIEDIIEGTDIRLMLDGSRLQVTGIEDGTPVQLFTASGMAIGHCVSNGVGATLPVEGIHGFVVVKIGNITRKINIR